MGVGTEFAELREYGVGDDPRFIDWKATARLSQPLVRVLEPEREQTLVNPARPGAVDDRPGAAAHSV